MVASRRQADLLVDRETLLGESPVWDPTGRRLLWVDITAGDLLATDITTGQTAVLRSFEEPTGFVVLAKGGDPVIGSGLELVRLLPDGGISVCNRLHEPALPNRFNDGKADPTGRLWTGTLDLQLTPNMGALYRWEGGRAVAVVDRTTIANGLDWWEPWLYFIDSARGTVDRFEVDLASGALGPPDVLVHTEQLGGTPDGMTLDEDGCLWVAVYGSGTVRRFSPRGELIEIVELPVPQPTSCVFGGPNLDQLFITSAAQHGPRRIGGVGAGSLFVCAPGVKGREANQLELEHIYPNDQPGPTSGTGVAT